ncbi:ECF transporter S component [Anaerotalea alkaliphila]|uniref:ECF transporter S component n=1 Tax=Anaerotalea alkaliphila TaxID=2662126 RepID=A0A7X5KPE6_9FIRM|nr:ECF transporter S component [Anaerotalea alkaliphila]NDL67982.1 hypothetical protein [Anaerotalea alkaliphila]
MKNKTINVKTMTYTSIMMALVFVGTYVVKIPIPMTNGYIHPGDSMVFLSGLILGPVYGAAAAGIGSALADLVGGYPHWILPTLVIKALMAAIVGYVVHRTSQTKAFLFLTAAASSIWILFIGLGRVILGSEILRHSDPSQLLGDFEEFGTAQELVDQASRVNSQLLLIVVAIPLLLVAISLLIQKMSKVKLSFIHTYAFSVAGMVMVFLYYLAYWIMYGNYLVPIFSIPPNILQFIGGLVIALLLLPVSEKIRKSLTF